MTDEKCLTRLLGLAKTRLANRPGQYELFVSEATSPAPKATTRLSAFLTIGEEVQKLLPFVFAMGDMHEFDISVIRSVDEWSKRQTPADTRPLPAATASPPAPASEQTAETQEQRQARRYRLCIDAGLTMPTNDYDHLPRGVGTIAKREGISRQAFAEDLKAHINRLNGR